jgi:hypothetical protein
MKEEPKEKLQPENTLTSWFVNEYAELAPKESFYPRWVYFKASKLLKAAHFLQGAQSLVYDGPLTYTMPPERLTENIANLEEIALGLIKDHGEDADTLDFSIEDIRSILIDAFGGRISDEDIEE